MKTFYKLLIVALTVSLLSVTAVNAQEHEEPNRLSIGLLGGVTLGHMNIGTEYDPTFGFNLRYAANPTFAIQTNFMMGEFTTHPEDGFDGNGNYFDRTFENSYFTTSVTSQINMLRLLGSTSETVNVYANVGLGLIFNDVETQMGNANFPGADDFIGEDHSNVAMFNTFGAGLRLNLGSRIDLFAQYDFNISNSDVIDGHRTRPETDPTDIDLNRRNTDNWSAMTGGIQIKLGSSSRDGDWHTYRPGVDRTAVNRLEDQIANLEERVHDNTARVDQNEDHIRALEQRMDEMERRLDNLEQMLEDMDRVELTIDSDVLFAFDSSTIRETAKPTLAKVVRSLAQNPEKNLRVAGHTCDIGAESYNQGLSERRAESVKRYLVQSGISADRITTVGYGETQPLVPNESEEARQLNRRVELVFD